MVESWTCSPVPGLSESIRSEDRIGMGSMVSGLKSLLMQKEGTEPREQVLDL